MAYDVIDVNLFPRKLMRFPRKKTGPKHPPHFIHVIKRIAYDVIHVNLFHRTVNEIPPQKRGPTGPYYTTGLLAL